MKNPLLYFSISILVLNLLFIIIAVANNFVGFFGALVGGSAAILTDPVILVVGILGGVALATQRIKFAVIALVVGAIIAAVVVHFILGTTRFIVDVVRVNVFLIIPSIIILIASGFNKFTNKTIKKKPLVKKVKVKTVNKNSNKGLRFILLIVLISAAGFLLLIPNSRESLVGEAITKNIFNPFFTTSRILKCTYKDWPENDDKLLGHLPSFKCYTIDLEKFITEHKLEKAQVDKWIMHNMMLLPELPLKLEGQMYGTDRVREIGTFYLKRKNFTNKRAVGRIINTLHPILFIILIFYTWRLRFCITAITANLFNRIKSEI